MCTDTNAYMDGRGLDLYSVSSGRHLVVLYHLYHKCLTCLALCCPFCDRLELGGVNLKRARGRMMTKKIILSVIGLTPYAAMIFRPIT
jgi:hypothetical protein